MGETIISEGHSEIIWPLCQKLVDFCKKNYEQINRIVHMYLSNYVVGNLVCLPNYLNHAMSPLKAHLQACKQWYTNQWISYGTNKMNWMCLPVSVTSVVEFKDKGQLVEFYSKIDLTLVVFIWNF